MYSAPDYKNRGPEEIISQRVYFDSLGHLYRAVSWLDHFDRTGLLPSLFYSCIEARMGIEHLLFEELILSTGLQLRRDDYERCLKNRMNFTKLIQELSPDYQKLQQFTRVVVELTKQETDTSMPDLIFWEPRQLEKSWGKLSKYLHWSGSTIETTGQRDWVSNAQEELGRIILPIWERMSSGLTGLLHPCSMESNVRKIWSDFANGKIDIDKVKMLLDPASSAR